MKKWAKQLIPVYILAVFLLVTVSYFGNRAVTVVTESAPVQRSHCFVIDAGHGGIDGGAPACDGTPESRINLEIALRLNDLFHLIGLKTVMIRTGDYSVHKTGETIAAKKVSDLKERVRIVNETENGILISIHQNYFSDGKYSGAQVFYAKTSASKQLAEMIQEDMVRSLNPGSNRKCKKASGVYLMEHILCPGVLIECGFISNEQEGRRLKNPQYQKKVCCVIASSCSRFLAPDAIT